MQEGFLPNAYDNNIAERAVKPFAIGRKNWLFFNSDQCGKSLVILSSFTATCQKFGINPWTYLRDTLTKLPTTTADQLHTLLPIKWFKPSWFNSLFGTCALPNAHVIVYRRCNYYQTRRAKAPFILPFPSRKRTDFDKTHTPTTFSTCANIANKWPRTPRANQISYYLQLHKCSYPNFI